MDVESLLRSLNAHNVRYVIIGATAFPVHGFSRVTFDIDIFIRATKTNAAGTREALKDTGYNLADLTVNELLKKKILFRQYAIEADIHPFVKGVTWEGVWKRRVRNRIGRTRANFASLRDLMRMKKAEARSKDMEDLRALNKLEAKKKKRKRGKPGEK